MTTCLSRFALFLYVILLHKVYSVASDHHSHVRTWTLGFCVHLDNLIPNLWTDNIGFMEICLFNPGFLSLLPKISDLVTWCWLLQTVLIELTPKTTSTAVNSRKLQVSSAYLPSVSLAKLNFCSLMIFAKDHLYVYVFLVWKYTHTHTHPVSLTLSISLSLSLFFSYTHTYISLYMEIINSPHMDWLYFPENSLYFWTHH